VVEYLAITGKALGSIPSTAKKKKKKKKRNRVSIFYILKKFFPTGQYDSW
jgi:hypothetical protein